MNGTHLATINDGLANALTGSGTTVDKRVHQQWMVRHKDQFQIEAAYRGSWLMRKVVNLPPYDMTRAWRAWQAENPQIELLEAEETRLHVRDRIRTGLILGRLGGGIVIMGVADGGRPDNPLNPDAVGQGGLRYLHPLSRYQVSLGPLVDDPASDDFGEPEYFTLRSKGSSREARIHRSRVLVFKGLPGTGLASAGGSTKEDAYWGDSIVQAVDDAVMNAVTAQDEIAGLISEAKIDVYGIPDLLTRVGDPTREKQVMRRLEIANTAKSIHRAVVKDALETWEQRQITWAGMSEIIRTFIHIVAGAADIPATRLFGKSADGMNATGEGDERNYHEMLESQQESDLAPALADLDEVLIRSALGARPPEIYYDFNPLRVKSEKEEADIEQVEAQSVTAIVNSGLIPESALSRALANRLIESGRWPGLEAYLDDEGDKWWETVATGPDEDEGDDLGGPGNRGGGGPQPAPQAE